MKVLLAIPVYNEEAQLAGSIGALRHFLKANCPFETRIVIADNGSTDGTLAIARSLCELHAEIRVVHLDLKGRGRALKRVWSEAEADILTYMDVDLSTDMRAFPPLVEALVSGQFDLVTGSRLLRGSQTQRSWKRDIISRCYNALVKCLFHAKFSDAQCGFKGITREAAGRLLPAVEDPGWFFDTELLLVAEKCGYRVLDLPVKWIDDPDSRVRIFSTAWHDLKGLVRIRRNLRRRAYAGLGSGRAGGPGPVEPALRPHECQSHR